MGIGLSSRSVDPFLDIDFKRAEGCFVTLDCQLQDLEQAFRCVQVRHDSLCHRDWLRRGANRLRIQPKIDH